MGWRSGLKKDADSFAVYSALRFTLRAALPWMVLCLLLLAAGLWILVQPMEMRGTMMMYGLPGG